MSTLEKLSQSAVTMGKPEWRPMLAYVAALHARSTHPAQRLFPYPWEEIGPGYCYGPAFGHWDLIHAILDVLPDAPEHARQQLLNNLANQEADGLVPGAIWMPRDNDPSRTQLRWSKTVGHPPVWMIAVQDYADLTGSDDLIPQCYDPLLRQIAWFETQRKAEPDGFYYTDILTHSWESGIDEGVRFHNVQTGPFACVDATAHGYALYDYATKWATRLSKDSAKFAKKREALQRFIRETLFDIETGFFHDVWAVNNAAQRPFALEGMWPVVVGAATAEQAQRVIDENLLNPKRFFSAHPVSTVGVKDPLFELRMWRGPTWNSMTYWAARGCVQYGHVDTAHLLVEKALDASAAQFARTGTVWEFYHPHGGNPETLQRKPHTPFNTPCRDYLGHNPLIAMARLWDTLGGRQ
ncbi:MAG: glycoside hydrolase [Anaerolineae bacterium]|nr:glycoside hydrolase [Anaerolineae bacterium]